MGSKHEDTFIFGIRLGSGHVGRRVRWTNRSARGDKHAGDSTASANFHCGSF